MAKTLLLMGDSGTGKSTSFRNLDPQSTYIIKVYDKQLPWKGSSSQYVFKKGGNMKVEDKWDEIIMLMRNISDHRPEIKTLILDDFGYMMTKEYFNRSGEGGYQKFADFGNHTVAVITAAEKLRDDLKVVFVMHVSEKWDEYGNSKKLPKTVGKLVDDTFVLEGTFETILVSNVEFDNETGQPFYHFVTNKTRQFPGKSPMGMFENIKIENDLSVIFPMMDEYFSSEN